MNVKTPPQVFVRDILFRIIVGGVVVSLFSLIGTLLKPKSFAGLFGAAPSVALATLFLTVSKDGKQFASTEARSMILGAIAFAVYAFVVSRLLIRHHLSALPTTALTMTVWFGCAFGLWYVVLN